MSGEEQIGIRHHLEALIKHEHELNEVRYLAAQEAVTQFRTTTESRFASVNEFRGTLTDQASTFASRDSIAALAKELSDISTRLSKLEARLLAYSAFLALVLAVASVFAIWLHK
jgi:hypothetical protein